MRGQCEIWVRAWRPDFCGFVEMDRRYPARALNPQFNAAGVTARGVLMRLSEAGGVEFALLENATRAADKPLVCVQVHLHERGVPDFL